MSIVRGEYEAARTGRSHEAPGAAELSHGERSLCNAMYEEAEAAFEAALAAGAQPVTVHYGLGRLYLAQDRIEDACDSLHIAVHYDPSHAASWIDLARALWKAGDSRQSLDSAAKAHACIVTAEEWSSLAHVYKLMGQLAASADCYERACALDCHSVDYACQLGYVRYLAGDYARARSAYTHALRLNPDFAPALHNLGLLLLETGCTLEALESFERAYKQLQRPESLACVGHALRDLGRLEEACAAYEAVLKAYPSFGDARINLAYACLMREDLAEGWVRYESRFRATDSAELDFGLERWQGTSMAGRTLLIHGEQGLGDEIMFASCMPDLLRTGGRFVLLCNPRLVALFARSFPNVQVCAMEAAADAGAGSRWEACDFQLPIGSLPRYFRRIPDAFPGHAYLHADAAAVQSWKQRFNKDARMQIGIAWRGGALRTRQWLRSTSLADWRALLTLPHCRFVSLQHGDHHEELAAVSQDLGIEIEDMHQATHDIDELASLVSALDLVITVDNSLVHLAGALGQKAWVLLPAAPEWRYPRTGERMPWFSSVTLFRGEGHAGATAALPHVAAALRKLVLAREAAQVAKNGLSASDFPS